MAKKAQEIKEAVVVVSEEVKEDTKMVRANRVSINATEDGYKADFYRTHKKITTVLSNETGWEADDTMNKTAQREDFRQYMIKNAEVFGIEWKPQDMRADSNKRIAKYESDEVLTQDTIALVEDGIKALITKCPYEISLKGIEVDEIVPVAQSAKGTDLSKLGVIEGKYERSGNWAWADLALTVTMMANEEIYYTTKCQLVSGQLKKPHITQTSFNESVKASLIEIGQITEETKEEAKEEEAK